MNNDTPTIYTPNAPKAFTKKVFIKTWGCQMNVYDSARMADVLAPLGYEEVGSPEDVDLIILNTCHIREKATHKVFSELGRLREHKDEKEAKGGKMLLAVAGCVAQAEGDYILEQAPYVDIVMGSQSYHLLPELVSKAENSRVISTEFPEEPKFDFLPEERLPQGLNAFLAIQEGCDNFCTYCVVPYTRGAEYSRNVSSVMDEARKLADSGVKEITLLGQNVNSYHGEAKDGSVWKLARLLEEIAGINGLERLRYMTSHPSDMEDELIHAHRDIEKLMPYLHLPIQSGSDRVLRAMNRKHSAAEYLETINTIKKVRPDMALSSDFIVGFPGETDQDFEDTMNVVREVGYSSAYSFMYSARPGTPAATMKDQVVQEVSSERLARLQELLNSQQEEFNKSTVGKTVSVLFERSDNSKGIERLYGRTPYNQSIYADSNGKKPGEIHRVEITVGTPNSVRGKIVA